MSIKRINWIVIILFIIGISLLVIDIFVFYPKLNLNDNTLRTNSDTSSVKSVQGCVANGGICLTVQEFESHGGSCAYTKSTINYKCATQDKTCYMSSDELNLIDYNDREKVIDSCKNKNRNLTLIYSLGLGFISIALIFLGIGIFFGKKRAQK